MLPLIQLQNQQNQQNQHLQGGLEGAAKEGFK
jgi:hypothetical protein